MRRMFTIGERILLTLWVGGMWSIGYMAVPSLFYTLDDRQLAGELAGQMFSIIYVVGLGCCGLLIVSALANGVPQALRAWRVWVLVTALALLAISFFVFQPMMQELKLQGLREGSEQASQFAKLHGISSAVYLATSLLGLILVVFGLRRGESV